MYGFCKEYFRWMEEIIWEKYYVIQKGCLQCGLPLFWGISVDFSNKESNLFYFFKLSITDCV